MKIFLREISENERSLSFSEQDSWVLEAVSRVDELHEKGQPTPPTHVEMSFRTLDNLFELRGNFETTVQLLCSRCTQSIPQACRSDFALFFTQDKEMAGLAHVDPATGKLEGTRKGHMLAAGGMAVEYDITHLAEDFIDLTDVLTEQIQLQVPFQPLCKTGCRGICPVCGKDRNTQPCKCEQEIRHRPFSNLGNFS